MLLHNKNNNNNAIMRIRRSLYFAWAQVRFLADDLF